MDSCPDLIKMDSPCLVKKSWDEFRSTGLVVLINSILHVFGWAITFDVDDNDNVVDAYIARTTFRGFGSDAVEESYKKISKYMKDNADVLLRETVGFVAGPK